jgi:hypothetical protein
MTERIEHEKRNGLRKILKGWKWYSWIGMA